MITANNKPAEAGSLSPVPGHPNGGGLNMHKDSISLNYDIHKVSVDLQRTTDSDQFFRENLREILVILLTKNIDNSYPWNEFSWRMSGTDTARTDSFKTFAEYLKKWSKYTIQDFRDLFHDDNEIVSMLDAVDPDGRTLNLGNQYTGSDNGNGNNVTNTKRPEGNTKEKGLRRLRNQRKDLHQQVLDGELSVNAAMLQAGFRKRTATIEHSKEGAIRFLDKNYPEWKLEDTP